MSLFDEIRRDTEAGTPGDWTGHNMTHSDNRPMTPEEIGEYVCNSVKMSELRRFLFVSGKCADGGDCDICHVGNGPRGVANTSRIVNIPRMERALLAAEELAKCAETLTEEMCPQSIRNTMSALSAFREATE